MIQEFIIKLIGYKTLISETNIKIIYEIEFKLFNKNKIQNKNFITLIKKFINQLNIFQGQNSK